MGGKKNKKQKVELYLTWQTQWLHLLRSISVLGWTWGIVWKVRRGLERTQTQQREWSTWSLKVCLRGTKSSRQSSLRVLPLSRLWNTEHERVNIGLTSSHLFGRVQLDNRQSTVSEVNIQYVYTRFTVRNLSRARLRCEGKRSSKDKHTVVKILLFFFFFF